MATKFTSLQINGKKCFSIIQTRLRTMDNERKLNYRWKEATFSGNRYVTVNQNANGLIIQFPV